MREFLPDKTMDCPLTGVGRGFFPFPNVKREGPPEPPRCRSRSSASRALTGGIEHAEGKSLKIPACAALCASDDAPSSLP